MGFAADSSREAIKRCFGDIQQAINMLESCGGMLSSLQQLIQGNWLGLDQCIVTQISRSPFKQSHIYVLGCFVNFLAIFGYIWRQKVFSKD